MRLGRWLKISFGFLIVAFRHSYNFNYHSALDFFLSLSSFLIVMYIVYDIGIDDIRKKSIKKQYSVELLKEKERSYRKLCVFTVFLGIVLMLFLL